MSDLGDTFEGYRAEKQAKRAHNREWSAGHLKELGIDFSSHNGGAHLIVRGPTCNIDFWPGTGRWVSRGGGSGFGVRNLVTFMDGLMGRPEAPSAPAEVPADPPPGDPGPPF